jgi:hypothetical protein
MGSRAGCQSFCRSAAAVVDGALISVSMIWCLVLLVGNSIPSSSLCTRVYVSWIIISRTAHYVGPSITTVSRFTMMVGMTGHNYCCGGSILLIQMTMGLEILCVDWGKTLSAESFSDSS